jgi:DNA-binding MarR family transcriptional regulator
MNQSMKIKSFTQQSPLFTVYSCHNAIQAFYAKSLKSYNVNFVQAMILLTIYFEGNSKITPSLLVNNLGISKSSVSQALSILEEDGWLKRKIDQNDARSLSLILTNEGHSRASDLISVFHGIEKTFEKKLGKSQIKNLCDSLNEIGEILSNEA